MNKMRILLVFFGILAVQCVFVRAELGNDDNQKLVKLEKNLVSVQNNLDAVVKQIATKNKEYQVFQHDIVYTNGVPATIYAEIKAMEKELVEKRNALEDATMKIPGARDMLNERKALYNRKNRLAESIMLLRNEIYAVKLRVANSEADEKK